MLTVPLVSEVLMQKHASVPLVAQMIPFLTSLKGVFFDNRKNKRLVSFLDRLIVSSMRNMLLQRD